MIKWVIHKLASVLPPAIDADSAQMRFTTTHKRLFFREIRVLFFSQNGPVELALRPGHIVSGIGGGAGLAALVFLTPGLFDGAKLPSFSTVTSVISASMPQKHAHQMPVGSEAEPSLQATSGVSLPFISQMVSVFSDDAPVPPPVASASPSGPEAVRQIPQARIQSEGLAQTRVAARAPTNFTTIEEPNDELIPEPVPEQKPADIQTASVQASIAVPAARPAPEPMDPEFVAFDGLGRPPLQTEQVRLSRRFANVLSEIGRIEEMIGVLGITPEGAPAPWDPTISPAEEHIPALYIYRDRWREIVDMLPLKAPLRYYYVTSPYGMRTNKKTGVTRFHHGVDLAGTWRARLRPSASGVVTFAGRDGGFGKVVKIEHAHGVQTVYAHLSTIQVSTGSFVTPQDVLGTMGNSGHSDGMHLHYEIRIDGESIDPEAFFAFGHKLTVTGRLDSDL